MKTLSGKQKEIFKKTVKLSRGLYRNNFKELFPNGKDRIEVDVDNINFSESNSYKLVNSYLKKHGYVITDYVNGYAKKKGDDKNILKIGKLIKHNKYLIDNFRDCVYRQKIKLVISRHPYDIGCASWNQDWGSCLDIDDGFNKDAMINMIIANSCMIAYTVSKTNNKPLGRCFLIPYYNKKYGDYWLYPASTPYGLFPDECRDFLKKWIDENYNEKYLAPKLLCKDIIVKFTFPDDLVYDNDDKTEVKYFNYKHMNKLSIRKHINEGKIETILKESYKLTDEYPNLEMIKEEAEKWYKYHSSYGKDPSSNAMKKMRFLLLWIDGKEPDSSEAYEYLCYLSKYKFMIKRSKTIEKFLMNDLWMYEIKKYLNVIEGKIKCDEIKDEVISWGETGMIKKDGAAQLRLLEKLL